MIVCERVFGVDHPDTVIAYVRQKSVPKLIVPPLQKKISSCFSVKQLTNSCFTTYTFSLLFQINKCLFVFT